MKIVEMHPGIRVYAGTGHWNDPDMLEVGNGMSINEDRAHFSLWCMLAAPLMSGNDLSAMSTWTKEILTNTEVIAIDQDSLGVQGYRYDSKDSIEIWVKPLMKDGWAVCFLNRSMQKQKVDYDWSKNIITDELSKRTLNTNETKYNIRNLWVKKYIGTTKKKLTAEIASHDVLMVRLSK
jgi:alpha-galactosidase